MVVKMNFDEFDDELRSMQEIMEQKEIALSDADLHAPIKTLGLKKAVVVESGTPVKQCIETMLARHFGCLLVVKDGKLKGIFTERDVLQKIAGEKINLAAARIDEFMTSNPKSLTLDDPISAALRLMQEGGLRHIAVIDKKGAALSVLSIKDIVSYIVEFFPQDVLNLPPHPIRLGTKNREGA